jgi:hypothetical protein
MHKGCYQGSVFAANTLQEMVHTLMSKAGMDIVQDAQRFLQQKNWDLELCLQACKISVEAAAAKETAADAAAAKAAKNAEVSAAAKKMAKLLEASRRESDACCLCITQHR